MSIRSDLDELRRRYALLERTAKTRGDRTARAWEVFVLLMQYQRMAAKEVIIVRAAQAFVIVDTFDKVAAEQPNAGEGDGHE